MYDVTIMGCGVVGAPLAYPLSRYDLRVLVLERENDAAMGSAKANSAIVHAGCAPAHGTLMARLNIRGAEMMKSLCRDLSAKYEQMGSFVLAFEEAQKEHLEQLYRNGVENGVPGMELSAEEKAAFVARDPRYGRVICRCAAITEGEIIDAIHSPIPLLRRRRQAPCRRRNGTLPGRFLRPPGAGHSAGRRRSLHSNR